MTLVGSGDRSYSALTEGPGGTVTREGALMLRTRYQFAADQAAGRRVLEIGCGPAVGVGLLGSNAESVVGADYDDGLLRVAADTYGKRFPFVCLDAQRLPFADGSFDLVLFFEGTYYVPDMEAVFHEISRVLSDAGKVLFVNANPERPDFIRSPKSVRYHTALEFKEALHARGFEVEVSGAFPIPRAGVKAQILSSVRRVAESLGLIPKTLAGRAALKRLVFGRLLAVPNELDAGFGEVSPLVPVDPASGVTDFKVIYVMGLRRSGPE